MATDYDAPRRRAEDEIETDSLEGLKAAIAYIYRVRFSDDPLYGLKGRLKRQSPTPNTKNQKRANKNPIPPLPTGDRT